MERSVWTLGTLIAAALLALGSAGLPWYSFEHSTGDQTPPGLEDTNDEGVERREIQYSPFVVRGDASDEQRAEAATPVLVLGLLVTAAALLTVTNVIIELAAGASERTRLAQLLVAAFGFFVFVAALAYSWFVFPALLADEGVRGAFTTRNDQGTFIRSTLSWGWTLSALALIAEAASFAFKFAGGVFTLSFLDQYRSDSR